MTCDDNEVPPRFARTGADKWMRTNVVMNGAVPWDSLVRIEQAEPRQDAEGDCLSSGRSAIRGRGEHSNHRLYGRLWCCWLALWELDI